METINQPISSSERTLLVVPMHKKSYDTIPYPASSIRRKFPLAYSYLRGKIKRAEVNVGDIVVEDVREGKVICWIIIHSQSERKYSLESIERAVERIAAAGLHQKYDMAFPALGCYSDDGVDLIDVIGVLKQHLGDAKHLSIHTDY